MPKTKRVVVLSDFHCGHEVGLTPPKWNPQSGDDAYSEYRAYLWKQYADTVRSLQPIDILVANGDLVDGRGDRSGSLEVIVLDRLIQCQMAAAVIRFAQPKKVFVSRGTDYHVGKEESFEDLVAEQVKAERIGDVLNIDVNGLMFNFRHHIGGSQSPLGRQTPLSRESVWNALWNVRQGFPLADIIVRSHVHYLAYAGGPGWLAMTTPALQGYGTRYGERRLSGIVDFGFVYFDVVDKGHMTWKAITFPFPIPEPSIA